MKAECKPQKTEIKNNRKQHSQTMDGSPKTYCRLRARGEQRINKAQSHVKKTWLYGENLGLHGEKRKAAVAIDPRER